MVRLRLWRGGRDGLRTVVGWPHLDVDALDLDLCAQGEWHREVCRGRSWWLGSWHKRSTYIATQHEEGYMLLFIRKKQNSIW